MKKYIPRPLERHREIEMDEIGCDQLTSEEQKVVEQHIKKYNVRNTILMIPFLICALLSCVYGVNSLKEYNVSEISSVFGATILFCIPAIALWRMRLPQFEQIEKKQIGEFQSVWSAGFVRETEVHYIYVVFPKQRTYCRTVRCYNMKEFKNAKKGDRVLVMSYRKRIWGCLL